MLLMLIYSSSYAQSNKLKLNLDETGKTYVKASVRMQLWARYMDTNPGTTINNEVANNVFDVSLRRLRMGISAQLTPKLYVYSLFGGNNMNSKSEKDFQFGVLDLYAEYEFAKEFSLGFGESGWEGLNRWNVRSSKSLMAIDAPLFSLLTVNKNDDIARGLGIWAKGQIHKFDYIISLDKSIKEDLDFNIPPWVTFAFTVFFPFVSRICISSFPSSSLINSPFFTSLAKFL